MPTTADTHVDEPEHSVGLSFWLKISIVVLIAAMFASFVHQSCVVTATSMKRNASDHFIGLNARIHLQRVTSFGSRTAGSIANEILTPEFLRQVLRDISFRANASGLLAIVQEQISGYSSFQTHFHVTSYKNLRNFILRIHDPRITVASPSRSAFLVNCHYDSAITSPGASDAFAGCAIMLEAARVISSGNVNMVNDLIFLFNGAEENILPSSHAFVTQHPWAPDVVAFLNLEGAGAGGRLFLFQSGPGEASELLMWIYAQTFSQPFGQVMGEELFQSGVIPSDTDFRIFRDYGLIPGIDMAYTTDGYCYHTPYDTESRITAECLQKTGEDVLNFLTAVAQNSDLVNISRLNRLNDTPFGNFSGLSSDDVSESFLPKSKIRSTERHRQVYFDLLGLKMFVMSWESWKTFNWILSLCLFIYFIVPRCYDPGRSHSFFVAIFLQLTCQFCGLLMSFSLGWVIRTYGCRMSWYSTRHNIVGIFILPFLCWNMWFHTYIFQHHHGLLYQSSRIRELIGRFGWDTTKRSVYRLVEQDLFDSAIFILSVLLIILNLMDSRIVYIPTIWLTAVMFGRVISRFVFPFESFNSVDKFILTFLLVLVCHSHLCIGLFDFIIPLFGRAGNNAYPDITLSLCTYFLLIPVFLFLAGPLQCTTLNCGRVLRVLLLNACLSYAILVHGSPYGFPYTVMSNANPSDPSISPRYQRVGVIHNDRTLRFNPDHLDPSLRESHIWIIPLDDNGIRYLKPEAYPMSVPSSLLSVIYRTVEPNSTKQYKGLAELSDYEPLRCNRSLPYCGLASPYPFIHKINGFFPIQTTFHNSQPKAELRLVSRKAVNITGLVYAWNFTFTVVSGPPNTQILMRFQTPDVRLISWSFNSSTPVPIPMPLPKDHSNDNRTGAHYLINHIDAGAVNASGFVWNVPWTFWIVVDFVYPNTLYFDIVIVAIYVDENLPSGSSPQLSAILSRLPPWVVTLHACTSYDHYRFGLH